MRVVHTISLHGGGNNCRHPQQEHHMLPLIVLKPFERQLLVSRDRHRYPNRASVISRRLLLKARPSALSICHKDKRNGLVLMVGGGKRASGG